MVKIKFGLRLLETLTSALYDNPLIIFREYVQNSVDAYNLTIDADPKKSLRDFNVNILINREQRSITIEDNGYGIPEKDFKEKMTSIGFSDKSGIPDQIGFRGIGRLSAMPFCDSLTFCNKHENLNKTLTFTWDGTEFHNLLNLSNEPELESAINQLTKFTEEQYLGEISEHFFKVTINGYNEEIRLLLESREFEDNLKLMLPLDYSPDFSSANIIKKKYNEIMGASFDKFCFKITLNEKLLYKPYDEKHVLGSGIIFWELKYPSKKKGIPGKKIGLLWFTFNSKVSANPANEPYGIFVRSKNMLMGDHNALADAVVRSKSDDYITTFDELSKALRGVYGEMLINSPDLEDNARRDWFRINQNSISLKDIIVNFLKELHTYRYVASNAFKAIENDNNKAKLKSAYVNLTSSPDPQDFVSEFYKEAHENKKKKIESSFQYADEDIPRQAVTFKRFYDNLMALIKNYFINERNVQGFLKLRSFIKKEYNKE